MKNLIKSILLLTSIFILSCSKDDDDQIVQEYFPTKIVTTIPGSSSSNGTTTIVYDDKNRISQFKYEKETETNSFEVTYNSDDLVSKIVRTKTIATASATFTANFSYTNKILSNINLVSSSTNENMPVTYQSSNNSYLIEYSTSETTLFRYDSNENLILYSVGGSNINFSYNDNKGIYNINENNLPFLYASFVSGFNDTLNLSWFFSKQEISQLTLGSKGSIVTDVIKDDKNNITQIRQKDGFTNEVYLTSTVEYELRTIN